MHNPSIPLKLEAQALAGDRMENKKIVPLVVVGLLSAWAPAAHVDAQSQAQPKLEIPKPGVSQVMTMEGRFVRAAYNNEGYAILGYQVANRSLGEEWMLLEVGLALRDRVPDYTMLRDALSLETPDGKTIPLASIPEHREGNTAALQNRARVQRDSINYFPPNASRACALVFFPELGAPALPRDDVFMDDQRACVGRLFFKVPGGIKYGQYWLNVKFAKSLVRVPFRILTEEEEKFLSKNYKDISKQVEDAFKKKS
jgi:hypothetical protein